MHRPWTELAFLKQSMEKIALCLHSYLLLFIFLLIEHWEHSTLSLDSGFSSEREADCDENSSFLLKNQLKGKTSTMTKYPINLIFNPQQPEVQHCGYRKSGHYWQLHIKF